MKQSITSGSPVYTHLTDLTPDCIIDQYGLGRKLRYPRIDSANYPVNERTYRTVLKNMVAVLAERSDSLQFFHQPSLAVAHQLPQRQPAADSLWCAGG